MAALQARLVTYRQSSTRGRERRGFSLVLYVFALFFICALLALVIDVGYFYQLKALNQMWADTFALTALAITGTVSSGQTATQQDAVINASVARSTAANGLATGYWSVATTHNSTGDVTQVTLSKALPASTFFLNAVGTPIVTIGIQAVAVRNFVLNQVTQKTGPSGIQFFGCINLNMLGGITVVSQNFTTGVQSNTVNGGSNHHVVVQGSASFSGFLGSAGDLTFTGSASTMNGGSYQSASVSGAPGGGTPAPYQIAGSFPPISIAPAVATAGPGVPGVANDNNVVSGCSRAFNAGTSYVLDGGRAGITIPAGANLYATQVNLFGCPLTITGNPTSSGAGPVTINLDAQFSNALSGPNAAKCIWFNDRSMSAVFPTGSAAVANMLPSYLRIIGINPPSTCTSCCTFPLIAFQAAQNISAAEIYAPGFQVDFQANPTFKGNVLCDYMNIQGNPTILVDDTNRFVTAQVSAPGGTVGKVHLIQ